jgi:hypothetical protein
VPALDLRQQPAPVADTALVSRRDRAAWIAIAATIVTILPALVVLAKFAFRDVLLTGDFAVIDARVRDVWSGPIPLVGPYSNGWNHPGPMYFYAFAPLHALTGGQAWTIVASGVLLEMGATLWSAWLAWRRGRLALTLIVLATLSLSMLAATDRLLLDPWNPHVAMPFFVVYVLLLWSVMLDDRWQLLGATVVGSFLVQSHVGYAPVVVGGALVALAWVVVDARRDARALAPWRMPVAASLAAAFVCWLPPIIEQVTHDPGNFERIARYFREAPEPVLGLRDGIGTFAAQYRWLPTWLGGSERFEPLTFQPSPASPWWLLVPVALLGVAFVVARRRRLRAEIRLVGLVAVLGVAGMLALTRLKQGAWSYMSLWRIPLAVVVVAVAAWTLWRAVANPPFARRVAGATVLGMAILGGALPITRDVATADHVASFHDDVAAVLDQLDTRGITDTILVRNVAPALRGVAPSIIDELDRHGTPVKVDPRGRLVWGSSRVARPATVDRVWIVTEDGVRGALLSAAPGARVLAHTSPLRPAEDRELSRLQRQAALELMDAGRSDLVQWLEYSNFVPLLHDEVPELDPATIDRIATLVQKAARTRRCRCTVVEFAPDELPGVIARA